MIVFRWDFAEQAVYRILVGLANRFGEDDTGSQRMDTILLRIRKPGQAPEKRVPVPVFG